MWPLTDIDYLYLEISDLGFNSGSEETGVGGGFLEGAGDGDDFVDHLLLFID